MRSSLLLLAQIGSMILGHNPLVKDQNSSLFQAFHKKNLGSPSWSVRTDRNVLIIKMIIV